MMLLDQALILNIDILLICVENCPHPDRAKFGAIQQTMAITIALQVRLAIKDDGSTSLRGWPLAHIKRPLHLPQVKLLETLVKRFIVAHRLLLCFTMWYKEPIAMHQTLI